VSWDSVITSGYGISMFLFGLRYLMKFSYFPWYRYLPMYMYLHKVGSSGVLVGCKYTRIYSCRQGSLEDIRITKIGSSSWIGRVLVLPFCWRVNYSDLFVESAMSSSGTDPT
jgi:hypothetical protein